MVTSNDINIFLNFWICVMVWHQVKWHTKVSTGTRRTVVSAATRVVRHCWGGRSCPGEASSSAPSAAVKANRLLPPTRPLPPAPLPAPPPLPLPLPLPLPQLRRPVLVECDRKRSAPGVPGTTVRFVTKLLLFLIECG